MLDPKKIRKDPDAVKAGARKKHFPADALVDRFLELDEKRRTVVHERDELKAEQNRVGKEIAKLSGAEKAERGQAMKAISARRKDLDGELATCEEELNAILLQIPNLPDDEVPEGADDGDNVELRKVGTPPDFDFEPLGHLELGESLDLIDMTRAAKLSGSRMYILKNEAARLELAVLQFTLDRLGDKGFSPMIVPTLVRRDALVGTAYFPGGEDQAYKCADDDLYLIGTSEVPVTSYHSGETLSEEDLPILYAGYSTCYRREAGAAGRDTKGLYRIHQFAKVEQVVICKNDLEESLKHHRFILANAESILQDLELPYRVVNVCGGDLGVPQVQKFDIETWMPSRNGYGETHSASRFYDYQSRRMDLRYRDANGKIHFCHTLNNTAIASPRILIALIENYQRADGSVGIPKVLQPYMGGLEVIGPRRKGPSG